MDGIKTYDESVRGFRVSRVHILTANAAADIGKAVGEYTILHTGRLCHLKSPACASNCLAFYLRKYLRPHFGKALLICGLGNQDLAEDSLGPRTIKKIPAHIMELMEVPSRFSSVAHMIPGVQWYTNLRTEIALSGVAKEMGAACVIIVDSVHTENFENLASTIQITTGQMKIKDNGYIFSRESLGIPIIGIGVPLIMSYAQGKKADMVMRTGIEDDLTTAAFAIAYAISRVAYPKVGPKRLEEIIRAI